LYTHGCDDALIGIGRPGQIGLDFTRDASSADEAIGSAVRAVASALPGASLIEVSPDLVGTTEIARFVSRSRQNVRKLLLASDSRVPAPVHGGPSTLWHLAPILEWLRDAKGYRVDPFLVETARAAMCVNAARAVSLARECRRGSASDLLGIVRS
jgi:hypothetical protein